MSFVTVTGDANRTFVFDSTRLEVADVISYSITLTLAVLSNTCLLVLESKIWLKHRRLSQPRLLIILLALVDTILCIFGILPKLIISSLTPCSVSQVYMLTRFTLGCFGILSKLTVVLMGVERFISIRAPFFYVRNCTIKAFVVVHIILVMYSLLLGSVSVFFDYYLFQSTTKMIQNIETIKCQTISLIFEFEIYPRKTTSDSIAQWQYVSAASAFTIFQLMQDCILIILLLICNTSVISGLRDMEKRLQVSCPRSTSDRSNAAQDLMTATGKEFSRLMIAINIVVLLLITPEMVRILFNYLDTCSSDMADFICQRVALCTTFVNPFLYGLLRKKLRRNIRVFLSNFCLLCRPIDVSPIELTRVTDSQVRLQLAR